MSSGFTPQRLEHVSLSYNGGKDCLVLLVLIMACLPAWASSSRPSPPDFDSTTMSTPPQAPASESAVSSNAAPTTRPLQAIYIVSPHPFAEVEDFVCSSAEQYHLDLKRYALPMRPALEAYLKDRPAVKAIFLGTRRTDPHGEFLSHFNPTDEGWPQFMRVHPVIDWHYVEIWAVSLSALFRFLAAEAQWSPIGAVLGCRSNEHGTNLQTVHSTSWHTVLRAVQSRFHVSWRRD
jgi:FAD synthetase